MHQRPAPSPESANTSQAPHPEEEQTQMTNWKHGYFADAGYVFGHQAETMPAWLQWAALIQGHVLPRKGFRYLDAGCGQGLKAPHGTAPD